MQTKLSDNVILMTDSYKFSHAGLYPAGTKGMFGYITARVPSFTTIVPFGLQMWMKKYLTMQITYSDIAEATAFCKLHGVPFDPRPWKHIVQQWDGYLPLVIKAVPEGTRVRGGDPIVTVECTDKEVYWLAAYVETMMQRAVWYPTTIASNDYQAWKQLKIYADVTSGSSDVSFMLHDFGGRGVTCHEQAEIGGAAHLVYFKGSDTVEGVRAANFYYTEEMSGFSVPATEHSIQCAYGPNNQAEYLKSVLDCYATPGAIVSIVLDGYDVYREAQLLCSMKEQIIKSGAKIVFRPDSGDPLVVIPRILQLQEMTFGCKINSKGYKVINNVGIIQGDGIDTVKMVEILECIRLLGYSSDCIVFGSGGALLQKVNRDTYKFAQKVSAIMNQDGEWVDVFKDPVTDSGKKSLAGRVTLYRSSMTGELLVGTIGPHDSEWTEVLVQVYSHGIIQVNDTLEQIRARAIA